MADNIQEVFWMLDAETKHVIYVNEAYETITGRSCEASKTIQLRIRNSFTRRIAFAL